MYRPTTATTMLAREQRATTDMIIAHFGRPGDMQKQPAPRVEILRAARRTIMVDDMVLEWLQQHLQGGTSYEIANGIGAQLMAVISALNLLERHGAVIVEQPRATAVSSTTTRYSTAGPLYRLSFDEWVMSHG